MWGTKRGVALGWYAAAPLGQCRERFCRRIRKNSDAVEVKRPKSHGFGYREIVDLKSLTAFPVRAGLLFLIPPQQMSGLRIAAERVIYVPQTASNVTFQAVLFKPFYCIALVTTASARGIPYSAGTDVIPTNTLSCDCDSLNCEQYISPYISFRREFQHEIDDSNCRTNM